MKERENKRRTGIHYEEIAAAFLEQQKYEILERNYYTARGEIDLIARDGEYLVFIEVKYRRDSRKGYPEEAVDSRKQHHIMEASRYYLYHNRYPENTPCRFDVVSILGEEIRLIQDAFRQEGS